MTDEGLIVRVDPDRLAQHYESVLATVRQHPEQSTVAVDDLDTVTVLDLIAGPDGPDHTELAAVVNGAYRRGLVAFMRRPHVTPELSRLARDGHALFPHYAEVVVTIADVRAWHDLDAA